MRISHQHKFIWISKPKTGSTAYRQLLNPYSDIESTDTGPFWHHVTLASLYKTFESEGWDFDAYYKVIACRNPFSLLVSLYSYSKTDVNGIKIFDKSNKNIYQPKNLMTFSNWINLVEHHQWFKLKHRLEVYSDDASGNCLANLIFAADQPSDIFKTSLQNNCGLTLEMSSLQRLNVTSKTKDLVDEVRDNFASLVIKNMIQEIFAKEIELFSYENPY
jgi:hypothetical protein